MLLYLLAGAVSLIWFLYVSLSPRQASIATLAVILCLPKITIIAVPGSTIGVRPEDFLIATLALRLAFDFARHQIKQSVQANHLLLIMGMFLPIGIAGIALGLTNGTVDSITLGCLYLLRRFEYFAMFFIASAYAGDTLNHRRQILHLLEFSLYVNGVYAVLQSVGVISVTHGGRFVEAEEIGGRVAGAFSGAYELAAFCVLIMPYFVCLTRHVKSRVRGFIGIGVSFGLVVMAQSRIGLISFIVSLIVMISLQRGYTAVRVFAVASSWLLIIGWVWNSFQFTSSADSRWSSINLSQMWDALWTASANGNYHNIGQIDTSYGVADASFEQRIGRWFNYVDGLKELSPLVGLGPSSGGRAVDSNYLRIAFEFGILGVAVLIVLLCYIYKQARKVEMGAYRMLLIWGGFGLLIQALFIDVFEASKIAEVYWFLLGVALTRETIVPTKVASGRRPLAVEPSRYVE